jgi:hypothetical protein
MPGFPNYLFPLGFPTKTPYTTLLSSIRATCQAHLILLYIITRKNLVSNTDHLAIKFSRLPCYVAPDFLVRTLFLNMISLLTSLNFCNRDFTPLKYVSKMTVPKLSLNFCLTNGRQEIMHRIIASIHSSKTALNFFLSTIVICYFLPNM